MMSIELSIKQVIEEQVQKVTQAYIQRLTNDHSRITKKLDAVDEKLNDVLKKLASHNNIISDRELSGDKIDGGTITNFSSTGIKDQASKQKLTINDDKITVENDIEIKGAINCKTLYYQSAKADNLDVKKSVRINNKEVLWEDTLGNIVTKSKLEEVGVLKELNVSNTLRVVKNFVGINTLNPNATLSVVKNGIEIVHDVKGSVAYVGTYASDDFSIGSGSEPTLFVSHDNKIGIKVRKPKADLDVAGPIRYQGQIHQYDNKIPSAGTYSQGDIVWNTKPVKGSVLGWVCVSAGSPGVWQPFVSL
jgi:hypothetical protein